MLFKTEGIVLRSIKYGDTSIISTLLTKEFGIQTYIINGARSSKKTGLKANLFQIGTLLDLVVYHHPLKNIQRIQEAKLNVVFNSIHLHPIKNALVIFFIELIQRSILEPEKNDSLFSFCKENILQIEKYEAHKLANFPVFITIRLTQLLGFGIQDNYSSVNKFFHTEEGYFVSTFVSNLTLDEIESEIVYILNLNDFDEINTLQLSSNLRKTILKELLHFYKIHLHTMPDLKSLDILYQMF
jgi:DNA repair protein RecO (recombination protein O)